MNAQISTIDRHQQAVLNTLSWADQSAAAGDFADAIAWLNTITAIGDELPASYLAKRASWLAAMSAAGELERTSSRSCSPL